MSSAEYPPALLDGWQVGSAAAAPAPLELAVQMLVRLGARRFVDDESRGLAVRGPGRPEAQVRLVGWGGEEDLRRSIPPGGPSPAAGAPLSAYAALRLAAAALEPPSRSRTLPVAALIAELLAAFRAGGGRRAELLRCEDGWLVARWRERSERELLEAMTGGLRRVGCEEAVREAREARLLVAPVRPPGAGHFAGIGRFTVDGDPRPVGQAPEVVDWSVLWAGPWAAGRLHEAGSISRLEHPRRRDGLLDWLRGEEWWRRLNRAKRLMLLDARDARDRRLLEGTIAAADVLITSMTPRALRSLGFDDAWRRDHAPGLLHVELVAFDEPWSDAAGLGEHAAAEAGLLWRGQRSRPRSPYPWADPLLGAAALLLCRAWLGSPGARGGRVRLSLEAAASLCFAAPEARHPDRLQESRGGPAGASQIVKLSQASSSRR